MSGCDRQIFYSFMLLLTGVAGAAVKYPGSVCAVRGSTVILPCTFTPVKSFTQDGREVPLKIIRVRWMEADDRAGHYTEQSGVNITVTEPVQMRIQSSRAAGELSQNQHVTLSCSTSVCSFHQLEVSWFKDGNALPQSGPALQLGPLTAKDSGNYTCALKANQRTTSLPFTVHVEEEEEEEEGSNMPLIVGVVFGFLLLLFTLILFLIRRSAAGKQQTAVGGETGLKQPDVIYSSTRPSAEQQQEVEPEAEEVSYASVQFRHPNPARALPEQEVDDIIYSSLASRR
ncbi:advanced glycosylation end product-specific receptor-like [Scomber scombrus]|uniref:Advanced glycosylation end product-specific receptor-like n=1 Tax=Scomber scombrus TaxID=13677 RepID=A0AAV1QE13_SCOSC